MQTLTWDLPSGGKKALEGTAHVAGGSRGRLSVEVSCAPFPGLHGAIGAASGQAPEGPSPRRVRAAVGSGRLFPEMGRDLVGFLPTWFPGHLCLGVGR